MAEVAPVDPRASLEAERTALRAELEELGGLNYDANFADSSQVTAERGETETLSNSLRETLEDVEAALVKLDEGTYGTCENCSKPIAAARLEAMPAAKLCMECASARR